MPLFGRKKERSSGGGGFASNPNWKGSSDVPETAIARPRREGNHWANEWQRPPSPPGSPGICGYLNGIKGHGADNKRHPERFHYVRPDGYPDDDYIRNQDSVPSVPSTRPVPKGFFGP